MIFQLLSFSLLFKHDNLINGEENDLNCTNGWKSNFSVPFSHRDNDHFFCDFDQIEIDELLNDNMQYFYTNIHDKKPLLIKASLSQWTNVSFWTKTNLLSKYGDSNFNFGESIDIVLSDGNAQNNVTLNDYININDNNDKYIFDRGIWSDLISSNTNLKKFKLWKKDINKGGIFMVSTSNKSGTGTTFHKHGGTFIALISGRKRYFLYPPYIQPIGGYPPSFSTIKYFNKIYPFLDKEMVQHTTFDFNDISDIYRHEKYLLFNKLLKMKSIQEILSKMESKIFSSYKPIECIQNEGDILYLPKLWWHAVLNLGDVIGISIQNDDNANMDTSIEDIAQFEQNGGGSIGHFFAGRGAIFEGNLNDAIIHYIKCILMDPLFIHCYINLYQIYKQNEIDTLTADKLFKIITNLQNFLSL